MSATLAPITAATPTPTRYRRLHLAGIVVAALVANAVVTTATDQILHIVGVYPPWGVPMTEVGDNLLALAYRMVYGIVGGYFAAALAPRRAAPDAAMRAALAYGVVGFVLSAIGGWVAVTRYDTGPAWYPVLLAAVALPVAWLGGALHRRRHTGRRAGW